MKTVLLADDHALVRAGIRSLLEKMSGIEVVAEAGDGYEALELTKKHFPNVVLMDIAIPGLNGLEALAPATKEFPAGRTNAPAARDCTTDRRGQKH